MGWVWVDGGVRVACCSIVDDIEQATGQSIRGEERV